MNSKLFFMRFFFFLALLSYVFGLEATQPIQTKLEEATKGDYIVTRHAKTLSLLLVKENKDKRLVLEEICVEESLASQKNFSWEKWVSSRAPGHTSWTLYEIDMEEKALTECFSISQNRWLSVEGTQNLFSDILKVSFQEIPEKEQKKIGPAPGADETDHRTVWHPSVVIEGKKEKQDSFSVFEGRWPNDQSQLAGCLVTLYYLKHSFPFPYWVEVSNGHISIKMPVVDSGRNLVSPASEIPHRQPRLLAVSPSEILLKCPPYYKQINLFAFDIQSNLGILIPYTKENIAQDEIKLHFSKTDLQASLSPNREYRWLVTFPGYDNIDVQAPHIFLRP